MRVTIVEELSRITRNAICLVRDWFAAVNAVPRAAFNMDWWFVVSHRFHCQKSGEQDQGGDCDVICCDFIGSLASKALPNFVAARPVIWGLRALPFLIVFFNYCCLLMWRIIASKAKVSSGVGCLISHGKFLLRMYHRCMKETVHDPGPCLHIRTYINLVL